MFGGTLAVVREPMQLLRARAEQDRLIPLLEGIAPGNALAFTELTSSGAREASPALAPLRRAVAEAGGSVRQVAAPKAAQLEAWTADRAAELGMRLDHGAARLLAERVGGSAREGDIDRRRMTEAIDSGLRLLALYRPGALVRPADVDALVTQLVPASGWAFLDAVGDRHIRHATSGAEALMAEGTALPVVVTQLHRRLRQLLEIRERIGRGEEDSGIARAMRLNPYRAPILLRQARAWDPAELVAALEGLVDVDLASKGLALGARTGDVMTGELALTLWLAERVARR